MDEIKVISLFSGIGGMDMGFGGDIIVHKDSISNKEFIDKEYIINNFVILKKQKFKIILQNDILKGAKEVYGYNNDISNYHIKDINDLLNNNFIFPEADIIIGGFPCQDFSQSGKRKGFQSNRGNLYKSFVEVVKRVKPKIFVAENVYGLLTMKNEPIKQIINDFSNEGYDVDYQVINCNDYGIPQTRKRVIIIGITKDKKINIENEWNYITKNKISCNVGKYLEHLEEPDITLDISQMVYSKAKKLEKGQGQKKINLNSFSPTIRAEHHGNIEFRRYENDEIDKIERRLTIREAGLIQTFPPNFIFNTKKNMNSYKYIGNVVPPLLSYLIADKVYELFTSY